MIGLDKAKTMSFETQAGQKMKSLQRLDSNRVAGNTTKKLCSLQQERPNPHSVDKTERSPSLASLPMLMDFSSFVCTRSWIDGGREHVDVRPMVVAV